MRDTENAGPFGGLADLNDHPIPEHPIPSSESISHRDGMYQETPRAPQTATRGVSPYEARTIGVAFWIFGALVAFALACAAYVWFAFF